MLNIYSTTSELSKATVTACQQLNDLDSILNGATSHGASWAAVDRVAGADAKCRRIDLANRRAVETADKRGNSAVELRGLGGGEAEIAWGLSNKQAGGEAKRVCSD